MENRVVVTSMGCISPLGDDIYSIGDKIINGTARSENIKKLDCNGRKYRGHEIHHFNRRNLNIGGKNMLDYGNGLELYAVLQAVSNYCGESKKQLGDMNVAVYLGNQMITLDAESIGIISDICIKEGSISLSLLGKNIKKLPPLNGVKLLPTIPSHIIAKELDIHGEGNILGCGDLSGLVNLIVAAASIKHGFVERAIVASSFAPFNMFDFMLLQRMEQAKKATMDTQVQLSVNPTGNGDMIYGEGAVAILIESEESAVKNHRTILAYIGGGVCNSYPEDDYSCLSKDGFKKNIGNTLKDSGIEPQKVDFIFTNSCGRMQWDKEEMMAIQDIWQDKDVKICSSKPHMGYIGCAAGLIDCFLSIQLMHDNTGWMDLFLYPDLEFHHENGTRNSSLNNGLVINAGWGGKYCSLILSKEKFE